MVTKASQLSHKSKSENYKRVFTLKKLTIAICCGWHPPWQDISDLVNKAETLKPYHTLNVMHIRYFNHCYLLNINLNHPMMSTGLTLFHIISVLACHPRLSSSNEEGGVTDQKKTIYYTTYTHS